MIRLWRCPDREVADTIAETLATSGYELQERCGPRTEAERPQLLVGMVSRMTATASMNL